MKFDKGSPSTWNLRRNWKSFLLLDSPRELGTGSLGYLPDLITPSSRQPFLTYRICHLSIPSSNISRFWRDILIHEFYTPFQTTVSSQFEKSPRISIFTYSLALSTSPLDLPTNSNSYKNHLSALNQILIY